MENNNCGSCWKFIRARIRIINCDNCNTFFHVKCSNLEHKEFKDSGKKWMCADCTKNNSERIKICKIKCGECKNCPPK